MWVDLEKQNEQEQSLFLRRISLDVSDDSDLVEVMALPSRDPRPTNKSQVKSIESCGRKTIGGSKVIATGCWLVQTVSFFGRSLLEININKHRKSFRSRFQITSSKSWRLHVCAACNRFNFNTFDRGAGSLLLGEGSAKVVTFAMAPGSVACFTTGSSPGMTDSP